MSAQNESAMRRFYQEVITQGNIDKIDEFLDPNFVEHERGPSFTTSENDRETVKLWFKTFREAFPDAEFVVEEIMTDGDKAVGRGRFRGTHRGPFMGITPTGRRIDVEAIDIVRFNKDGIAIEHWGQSDQMAMMQQLGVVENFSAQVASN